MKTQLLRLAFGLTLFAGLGARMGADEDANAINQTVNDLGQAVDGASDEQCIKDPCHEMAIGNWHGTFWVEYEISMPGISIPLKMRQRYQGTLEFEVKRRREDQVQAGPESNEDKITGKAEAEMKLVMSGAVSGANFNQSTQNQSPLTLDIEAPGTKNDCPTFSFLQLKRDPPTDVRYQSTQTVTAPSNYAKGTTQFGGSGPTTTNGQATGSGRTEDFQASAGTPTAPKATGGKDKRVLWFQLNVTTQSCTTVSGKVDENSLSRLMQSQGMNVNVTDSNWAATYDDRDVDFEKKVQQALAEPLGSPPSYDDIQHLVNTFTELRKGGDDYHMCVLQELFAKILKADLAVMRHEVAFVNWLPVDSLDQVMHSMKQIQQGLRFLQLLGADNCPVGEAMRKAVEKKLQQAVRAMLKRSHSAQEMMSVGRQWGLGAFDLGDVAGEFTATWRADGLPGTPGP